MGKQSDWVVHHLQGKMSAVCFRFHCALNLFLKIYHLQCKMSAVCSRFHCAINLLVKIYSSILCSLFENRRIAKPHLQGCTTHTDRRVEQCRCSVDRFQVHVEGCLVG